MVLARRAVARFSTRYSRTRVTQRQHVAVLRVEVKRPQRIVISEAFDRSAMTARQASLHGSVADLPVGGVTGIAVSGFERVRASTHDTKRANLAIQQWTAARACRMSTTVRRMVETATIYTDQRLGYGISLDYRGS